MEYFWFIAIGLFSIVLFVYYNDNVKDIKQYLHNSSDPFSHKVIWCRFLKYDMIEEASFHLYSNKHYKILIRNYGGNFQSKSRGIYLITSDRNINIEKLFLSIIVVADISSNPLKGELYQKKLFSNTKDYMGNISVLIS